MIKTGLTKQDTGFKRFGRACHDSKKGTGRIGSFNGDAKLREIEVRMEILWQDLAMYQAKFKTLVDRYKRLCQDIKEYKEKEK